MGIKITGTRPGKARYKKYLKKTREETKKAEKKLTLAQRQRKLRATRLARRRARILERFGYDVTRTYSALPGDDDTEGYPGIEDLRSIKKKGGR